MAERAEKDGNGAPLCNFPPLFSILCYNDTNVVQAKRSGGAGAVVLPAAAAAGKGKEGLRVANSTLTLVLLGAGLALFAVEVLLPGIGAAGIGATAALLAAVLLQIGNPTGALFLIALMLFLLVAALLLLLFLASRGKLGRGRLILKESDTGAATERSEERFAGYAGKTGVAVTPLRPAGKAQFGDEMLEVVTGGEFLPVNSRVKVVSVEGLRIRVRAVRE